MKDLRVLLACFAAASAAVASAVGVDGIAATVGTESILRSDVVGEMMRAGADESRFAEFRNRLIDRRLILNAAAESKMTLQEWVIDNRVREITDEAFGGDRNRLVAALAKQKLPYGEWRRRIKEDMIVGAMRWNTIDRYVTASPAEMAAEYEAHPERYRADAKTSVSVILLKPENAERRKDVDAELTRRPFAEVAKEWSADSRAAEGGLWKDVKPEEVFRTEIVAELAKLKVGETSSWIDLDGWSFLLRKESESAAGARSFSEAYDDIAMSVKNANAKKLYQEWMERLRKETYIKVY